MNYLYDNKFIIKYKYMSENKKENIDFRENIFFKITRLCD